MDHGWTTNTHMTTLDRYARAAVGGVLLAAPAALVAQARRDTTAADSARRVERVVITDSRTPTTTGGASAVVIRPDSLPIPTTPAPLLEQVLRQTPFVLVRQNSRGEVELSVRGSDSRQAAVSMWLFESAICPGESASPVSTSSEPVETTTTRGRGRHDTEARLLAAISAICAAPR